MEQKIQEYDVQKALFSQEKKINQKTINEEYKKFVNFVCTTDNEYYCLLCRELSDYTLFRRKNTNNVIGLYEEVIDLCKDRGKLVWIEKVEGGFAFWIKTEEEIDGVTAQTAHLYMFFPYDVGVIAI